MGELFNLGIRSDLRGQNKTLTRAALSQCQTVG